MPTTQSAILDLIQQAATRLPSDVVLALIQSRATEATGSRAELALAMVLENLKLAAASNVPLCQDTGFPTFWVRHPVGISTREITADIISAVREATRLGYLRPNAVDSLTGKNSGDNTGEGFPKIYFEESDGDEVAIELLLKGGGSENVSEQIALPAEFPDGTRAGRDLAGVKAAVIQTITNAKGYGCAPGIVSVHIGSDRTGGYAAAKKGLLRTIGTENLNAGLTTLEAEILHAANELNVGPMGFGGRTTLLDCRVSASHRLPASYFVTVAYICWATRRGSIKCKIKNGKCKITESVDERDAVLRKIAATNLIGESVKKLTLPLDEATVRILKVGEIVRLSGRLFLGRDELHKYAAKHELPRDLRGSAIYHCGPVAIQNTKLKIKNAKSREGQFVDSKNDGCEWQFLAAGPTTSIREEPYEADFIEKTGICAVIGKGGMGAQTLAALKKHGAVYLHAIGGAAALYARSVRRVIGVDFLAEFGVPEALWEVEVDDFLAVVTMDSHGGTLHE